MPEAKPEPPEPEKAEPRNISIDEHGNLRQMHQDRTFLSGPGPADVPDVMPSMEDEEMPSGMPLGNPQSSDNPAEPGRVQPAGSRSESPESSIDPFAPLKGDAPLLEHNNELSTSARPTSSASAVAVPDLTLPEPALSSATMGGLASPAVPTVPQSSLPKPAGPAANDHKTLSELEKSLNSPHAESPDVNHARSAVTSAIDAAGESGNPSPIAALNAQPLGESLHQLDSGAGNSATTTPTPLPAGQLSAVPLTNEDFDEPVPASASPPAQPLDTPLPPALTLPPASATPPTSSGTGSPSAPPLVPPPMMPFITPSGQ